eukprot:TRINITY_DN13640_c0_g1_i1.p1 TRINITY_DN13640_c0_g1~~TRINITY_DN13640_c0_g1_i1.p1  ORF type:complete len:324 (-),score=51.55 TRINITY_DN13640_c0_g1_i1:72-1043(-)
MMLLKAFAVVVLVLAVDVGLYCWWIDSTTTLGQPCRTIDWIKEERFREYTKGFSSSCVFLPSQKIHLHVLDNGLESNRTMLFAHGLTMSTFLWREQLQYYHEKGVRVIAFDFRAQGLSEVPQGLETIRLEELYKDVIELVEILEKQRRVKNIDYVGLSMGGFVGLRLAAYHPDMFRSSTLMSCDALPGSTTIQFEMFALMVRYFGLTRGISETLAPMLFSEEYARKNKDAITDFWQITNKNHLYRVFHGIASRSEFVDLKKIKMPFQLVYGQNDSAVNMETGKKITSQIENSKFIEIANSGHFMPCEQSKAVTEMLDSFYASL